MKFDSLAMIETNGLISAIVAVNKMLSIGNVKFLKKEVFSNGQVTLFIIGNSSEIKRILNSGIIAAQKVGTVISSAIVPYPNEVVDKMLFESAATNKPRKARKNIKTESKVDTLFDQIDDAALFANLLAKVGENNIDIAGEVLSFEEHKPSHDILEDKTLVSENESDSAEKIEIQSTPLESNEKILEEENIESGSEKEVEDLKDKDESDSEQFDIENSENSENSENDDDIVELIEEKIEEEKETKVDFEGMSHIERLRAEAKSEIENETYNETNDIKEDEIKSQINLEQQIENPVNSSNVTDDNMMNNLEKMNVPELRKLARSKEDFPIKGRDISKANRKVLLKYFKQL